MKLIHIDLNGKQSDVDVGFRFNYGEDHILEVVTCHLPHKASSGGKVTCKYPDGSMREYFTSIFDMEWIEREDRGWIQPEVELRSVMDAYKDIFGTDISGYNLDDVTETIRSTYIADFPDDKLEEMIMIKKWLDKQ